MSEWADSGIQWIVGVCPECGRESAGGLCGDCHREALEFEYADLVNDMNNL